MLISEKELQASLNRTEQRRERAREKRRRQKRKSAFIALVLFVVVGALALGITAGARDKPPPTTLAVTWPHGEAEKALPAQNVTDGTTLLMKPGQPLKVIVPEAGRWDTTWVTPDVKNQGDSFDWTPGGQGATLTVRVRAKLSGWKRLFAWRWPTSEIKLRGVAGQSATNEDATGFLREIEAPESGLWMHYRVLAKRARVRFDDRAIKAFGEVAAQMQPSGGNAPVWQLVPGFDSEAPAPGDSGTYALLKSANPALDAKQAFQILDRALPRATIKVIVDEADKEARFRLSFDDKGQRYVWVRQSGSDGAKPEEWLSDDAASAESAAESAAENTEENTGENAESAPTNSAGSSSTEPSSRETSSAETESTENVESPR